MIIRVDSSFHICLLHFKTFASKIFLSHFMYILNTNGVFTRHYETNWSETYAKQHNWNIKLYEANYMLSPLESKTELVFPFESTAHAWNDALLWPFQFTLLQQLLFYFILSFGAVSSDKCSFRQLYYINKPISGFAFKKL